MPQKIDGLSYPSTIDEVIAFKPFLKDYLSAVGAGELRNMVAFLMEAPTNGLKAYDKFLGPNASHPFGVDQMTVAMMQEAMMSARADDGKNWPPILTKVTNQVTRRMNEKELPDYFASKAFAEDHKIKLFERTRTVMGDTKEAAKRLGVKSSAYDLEQLMMAITSQDKKKIAAYCRLVIQDNNLGCDANTLVKALVKRQKLATADAPAADPAANVDVSTKKLLLCGFENVKDTKVKAAALEFAQAVALTDNAMIIRTYKVLMKLEKPGSLAANTNAGGMAKMFKKFKIVA
ncbi:hypothetical protein [Phaeobacter sp. B1627]|uniref:hypothetical protein n=1 Tax=Phaeobacter sp. B1627 TaxID=2583809 RepID=UPI00111B27C1|nr:hypothetical protein [Phaeobacter sp. B1627]TNJ48486.1 hypothetical protein FGE21_00630 [Phaeobacter sp. B1627]